LKIKLVLEFTPKDLRELHKDIQQLEEDYDDGLGGYTVKLPMIHKIEQMLTYPATQKGK
jgi:hypothetical protein